MASDAVTERFAQVRARHAVLGQALDALADRRHDARTTGPDHDPDGLAVIEACREEIDDFAILGMWAIFEEALHDWMDARVRWSPVGIPAFDEEAAKRMAKRIRHWSVTEKLAALKALLGEDKLGQLKDVLAWRDWVAHRKTTPRPTTVDVEAAVAVFESVLRRLATEDAD